ncbi:MAG: hypothetical protein JW749_07970 [Sedimentisphaerales bacterium]|nr:hypothetical protein [Sedimentisphaerales bacterium]
MCRRHIYCAAGILFCLVAVCFGQTIYFLVAETNPFNGDSYVLPLTEPNDIAHARDLIAYGPSIGQKIVVANIACNPDGINRDYYNPTHQTWSWHVTEFVSFAGITAEILDGWPGLVESDCLGWSGNGRIGFWAYTVVEELGPVPNLGDCDFDDDNDVDFNDFSGFGHGWGTNPCHLPDWCRGADFDQNGSVDYYDLKKFADEWLGGPPPTFDFSCWSWPYQCKGDADNKTETPQKYRVYSSDYAILNAAYNTTYPNAGYNPCADFNRDYKVYDDDVAIFTANWAKKDTQLQPPCPPTVP